MPNMSQIHLYYKEQFDAVLQEVLRANWKGIAVCVHSSSYTGLTYYAVQSRINSVNLFYTVSLNKVDF